MGGENGRCVMERAETKHDIFICLRRKQSKTCKITFLGCEQGRYLGAFPPCGRVKYDAIL